MLEELNNYNNDDKIEMAFPAEQKLEKTGGSHTRLIVFGTVLPQLQGRRCLGLPLPSLSCGHGTLGELQEHL